LQPTTHSWLQKLAITHHLKQTTKHWNIHNGEQHVIKKWGNTDKNGMDVKTTYKQTKQREATGTISTMHISTKTEKEKERSAKKLFTQYTEIPTKTNSQTQKNI